MESDSGGMLSMEMKDLHRSDEIVREPKLCITMKILRENRREDQQKH